MCLREQRCWRSSPQRPLRNKSVCLHAFCQQLIPPSTTTPRRSPLTERSGREDTEGCFARAFLNILLCSLFATPSFKSHSRRLFKRKKLAWWSISPHWENGSIHSLFMFLSLSTIVLTSLFSPRFSPSLFFSFFLGAQLFFFFLTSLQRSLGKVGRFFSALSSACKVNRREHVLKHFSVPLCFASLASMLTSQSPCLSLHSLPCMHPFHPHAFNLLFLNRKISHRKLRELSFRKNWYEQLCSNIYIILKLFFIRVFFFR